MDAEFTALREHLNSRLSHRLELYRLLDGIDDDELVAEVLGLAHMLHAGEIPPHIAATRVPRLYERATTSIYASNCSPSLEALTRWETNPRLRQIVATSGRLAERGVVLTRTFLLRRTDVLDATGAWSPAALATLRAQKDARIEVRVIWLDDIEAENLPPRSILARNFTLFDNVEALETTTFQALHRSPSDKLLELQQTRDEQLKYSLPLDEVLAAPTVRP